MSLRTWFVKRVYADHNSSAAVRRALAETLQAMPPGAVGVNVGSGPTVLDSRLVNVDLMRAPGVAVCADALRLPFASGSCAVVVSQEAVEHVGDPFGAVAEMARVLKPGGRLYCQVPFVIGYHPGPTDFWRFTSEGLTELVERAGLTVERLETSVGAGTGAYRILVELFATVAAALSRRLYHPTKALAALALFPLKWADLVTASSPEANRVPGGFLVIARKP